MKFLIVLAALSSTPVFAATCTTGDSRCEGKSATEDGGENCEMEPNQPMRFCYVVDKTEDSVSCSCLPVSSEFGF